MTADNVVTALANVAAELPGIGKNSQASGDQGGYAYRGIEAITREVGPLLAKHGVVFVPQVQSWDRAEVRVGSQGKIWHDEIMQITYTVYGPGGRDDSITVGPIPAIGRDGTDKGANKCMTQAFKYALMQVLCIADKADDGDQYHQEADSPPPLATAVQIDGLKNRLASVVKKNDGTYPAAWKAKKLPALTSPTWAVLTPSEVATADAVLSALEEIVGGGPVEAADPPSEASDGVAPVTPVLPGAVTDVDPDPEGQATVPAPGGPPSGSDYPDDLTRPF